MLKRIHRPLFAAFVGAALLVGACSGSSPATPPVAGQQAPPATSQDPNAGAAAPTAAGAGAGDNCTSVVTKDAVGQATGFPIATETGAAGICYFQNTDPSKYMVVWVFGSQDAMASMLQIESGSEHIDGLGDDAFWSGAGGILFVRKGDKGVEFQDPDFIFTADSNSAPRDAMVTLARTALPNF